MFYLLSLKMTAPLYRLILVASLAAVALPSCGQSVQLPMRSYVYPDSFAIYWTGRHIHASVDAYDVQLTFLNMYGDKLVEYEPSADSILLISFDPEYTTERSLLFERTFHKNGKPIHESNDRASVLEIIKNDPKIDALRALVKTSGSIENLQLLASAFEEEGCYANAFYVYNRMIFTDYKRGTMLFRGFYKRYAAVWESSKPFHRNKG
jgi:hypothetical protein